MKVAVIGAGASGLTAIKCCLDEGLEPVCYERTDDIGGLWRYSDNVTEGQACVMKSTIMNSSKEMMSYSNFPIPDAYPIFMHNTYVQKYLNLYCDRFNLKKYIQFGTEIVSVTKTSEFDQTGQWNVRIRNKNTNKTEDLIYDAVIVCTGHHADKNVPDFPGLSNFKGKVLHTHDYRTTAGFEDKRVVVIGIGNSGGDVAVELSRISSKVFISTRRGCWVINRIGDNGMPNDMAAIKRVMLTINSLMPTDLLNYITEKRLNGRFDHTVYGLKPKHHVSSQQLMINDNLPNRLASGTLIVKPNVKHFTENGVIFEDGTEEKDVDIVILATGYIFGFPFLDKSIIDVHDNEVQLYKFMFPPQLEKHTLCVIGLTQPNGAFMPISELQCRLATRVFQGKVNLPKSNKMMDDIKAKESFMMKRYVRSKRHTIQVDFIDYMDQLAELNGCLPDFKSMLLLDPRLAFKCYFGPCTSYQYRLNGPGKWNGARNAIMTQWDRVYAPLKSGIVEGPQQVDKMTNFCLYVVLVTIGCILALIYLL